MTLARDEGVRRDTRYESLSQPKTVFRDGMVLKEGGLTPTGSPSMAAASRRAIPVAASSVMRCSRASGGARRRHCEMVTSEVQVGSGRVRDIGGLDNSDWIIPTNGLMWNLYTDLKGRQSILIQQGWVPSYATGPPMAIHGSEYPPKVPVRAC